MMPPSAEKQFARFGTRPDMAGAYPPRWRPGLKRERAEDSVLPNKEPKRSEEDHSPHYSDVEVIEVDRSPHRSDVEMVEPAKEKEKAVEVVEVEVKPETN